MTTQYQVKDNLGSALYLDTINTNNGLTTGAPLTPRTGSLDGDHATIGTTSDSAVVTDASGTLVGFLRGIIKQIAACIGTAGSASANVFTVQGRASMTAVQVAGTGTAGTANAGVATIQGIASMTPVLVNGGGTAGTANAGVVSVQGIASMTPVIVKGDGTAGTAGTAVVTVQGVASMTPILATAAGDVASGSSDSGNPIKIGGKGLAAEPTVVTTGQRVNTAHDLEGRQVVSIHTWPENHLNVAVATITDNTQTSVIADPGASVKIALTSLTLANGDTSKVEKCSFTDGTTTWVYVVPASSTLHMTFPTPIKTAAHVAYQVTGSQATITSLNVSATYFVTKE